MKVKVVKNKLFPPFKECEFDIRYAEGFDEYGELLELASDSNVIEKSGQWYSYNKNIFAQGKEKARVYLMENLDFFEEVKAKVLNLHKPKEFVPNEEQKKEQEGADGEDVQTVSGVVEGEGTKE
jgi:recombination protein RecA